MYTRAIVTIVLFVLSPLSAHAALLYFDPGEATLYRGDTKTISLRIDTDEGECINTIDGVITYGTGIRAVDVSRGNSILNLWVENPVIHENENSITFAGGIPGGYCGRASGDPSLTNIVLDIVFQSPGFSIGGGDTDTTPTVSVADTSSVLLNDGFGTPAELRTQDARLTLLSTPGTERSDDWRERVNDDTTPPADFTITLARDDSAMSGAYFITWNSTDKQSGIDHYEVIEEPLEDLYAFRWGEALAPWVPAESPYILKDQTLNSTIRVKAIDKAGNETLAVLIPDDALRSISRDRIITLVGVGSVLVLLIVLIALFVLRRKRIIEAQYPEQAP